MSRVPLLRSEKLNGADTSIKYEDVDLRNQDKTLEIKSIAQPQPEEPFEEPFAEKLSKISLKIIDYIELLNKEINEKVTTIIRLADKSKKDLSEIKTESEALTEQLRQIIVEIKEIKNDVETLKNNLTSTNKKDANTQTEDNTILEDPSTSIAPDSKIRCAIKIPGCTIS